MTQNMPQMPENFNEEYYLAMNLDVDVAVETGSFKSGLEHFLQYGHKENRQFSPPKVLGVLGGGYFPPYLFAYPYSSAGKLKPVEISSNSFSLEQDLNLITKIENSCMLSLKDRPEDFAAGKSGMWSIPMQLFNFLLVEPLKNKQYESIAKTLGEMFCTNLTYGLGMGKPGLMLAKYASKPFQTLWADRLIRLAESLSVIDVRNIEQAGDYSAPLDPCIDSLIQMILKKCNLDKIDRPNIGRIYGVRIDNSIWHVRDFEHILAAITIKKFASLENKRPIMELGGGFGNLVYWLYKLGFRNITLYDLPQMNIIQAYYLSKVLPEAKICLYHEINDRDFDNAEIKILPYWHLNGISDKYFDVSINQDSLPEMPESIALNYLKEINRTTGLYFYSVNQEARSKAPNSESRQNSVPTLMEKQNGFDLRFRTPFWCRSGYVQEIYKIKNNNSMN